MPSADVSPGSLATLIAPVTIPEPPLVPRVAPRPSFRHAFTHSHCALGPLAYPDCSLELTGHVPPIDFCNLEDPRAHQRRCKPRRKKRRTEVRRAAGDPCSFRSRTSRVVSGQGFWTSLRIGPVRTPTLATARLPWIYPNLIDPDTPCREPMPDVTWNQKRRTIVR